MLFTKQNKPYGLKSMASQRQGHRFDSEGMHEQLKSIPSTQYTVRHFGYKYLSTAYILWVTAKSWQL